MRTRINLNILMAIIITLFFVIIIQSLSSSTLASPDNDSLEILFYEDFSTNLDKWNLDGNPHPYIDDGALKGNGDGYYASDAVTKIKFDRTNGNLVIQARIKISKTLRPGWFGYGSITSGNPEIDPTASIYYGFRFQGEHYGENLSYMYITKHGTCRISNISWKKYDTWHLYTILIYRDGGADFYVDETLHFSVPEIEKEASISNESVIVGSHDSPYWFDDILVKGKRIGLFRDHSDPFATTGDIFNINISVTSNVPIKEVCLAYYFENNSIQNITMIEGVFYVWSIMIPSNSLETLHYSFLVLDINGIWKQSNMFNRSITDNDSPMFGNDESEEDAYPGRNYTFKIEIYDNIGIDTVWIEYWFEENSHMNESMRPIGNVYEITISVPLNQLIPLSYLISAIDMSGNMNSTEKNSKEVKDLVLPIFLEDLSDENATTGDPFIVRTTWDDNIDIMKVHVVHWFYFGQSTNNSMMENNLYSWTIMIPFNSTETLHYMFVATDRAGNWGKSPEFIVQVQDNDPPIANAGEDINSYMNHEVILNGDKSTDNIAIESYHWIFIYNGKEKNLSGINVNFLFKISGNYSIILKVTDKSDLIHYDTIWVNISVQINGNNILPDTSDDNGTFYIKVGLLLAALSIILLVGVPITYNEWRNVIAERKTHMDNIKTGAIHPLVVPATSEEDGLRPFFGGYSLYKNYICQINIHNGIVNVLTKPGLPETGSYRDLRDHIKTGYDRTQKQYDEMISKHEKLIEEFETFCKAIINHLSSTLNMPKYKAGSSEQDKFYNVDQWIRSSRDFFDYDTSERTKALATMSIVPNGDGFVLRYNGNSSFAYSREKEDLDRASETFARLTETKVIQNAFNLL